jgi:predicted Zn finger-like uncharacterized protein
MPSIVTCPSCEGKLRIADELRGQRVRCPACGHTFDGAPPAPDLDPRDQALQLTIDESSSEPRPSSGTTPGLVGAVELKLSRDDEASSPSPSEPPRRNAPPRLADEHDDLKTCPECGKHVHRDSSRCSSCGERLDGRRDEPDVSSFRRRGPRRDAEPDRGATVLALGIISLACMAISCMPIGAILGLMAWIMGQNDLRKMKRGDMDSNGQSMTQAGWICGILGTVLNGLITLGCGTLITIAIIGENSSSPGFRTPVAPSKAPVQKWPPAPAKPERPPQKF